MTLDGSPQARALRVLREALEPHVRRSEVDRVIASALDMARLSELPPIGQPMRAFVEVHVVDALEAMIGPDAADRFDDGIDLLLHAIAIEHESAPAPRRADRDKLVLVASLDSERVAALSRALARHANVEMIPDVASLPAILWADLASVVVIDCTSVDIDELTLDELPASMCREGRVLLWGASKEVEQRFMARAESAWLSCAKGASAGHVANLVLALC